MKIDIITPFPQMFDGPFSESIVKRAQEKGLLEVKIHNLRDWARDKHKTVDDKPFGGGAGMVLMCQPVFDAIEELRSNADKQSGRKAAKPRLKPRIIYLSPQGKTFNQKAAKRLSKEKHLILLAGHYEGLDERAREELIDEEISIGDYVLTGGEIPAMVIVDAVARLVPGVLGNVKSTETESFNVETCHGMSLLEHPQYTRPAEFRGKKVPGILLSGNHQEVDKWRRDQALKRTRKRRPDLLK